jgi:hypothetical protein
MAVNPPSISGELAQQTAPVLQWPRMARLLAAAAVIGAIIGSVG